MPTLTSTGAVNLTSSTNWSPAQIPATGDDLIINGHTLTLDADMTLNSVTLNNANARLAYSGTTRSVQATNGWLVGSGQNLAGVIFTNTLAAGDSLTLTGPWSSGASNGNFSGSGIISATGGSLTLRTVGSDPSAVLFVNPPVVSSTRVITASWSGGTLTTIGRFDLTSWTGGNNIVTMSGGTWSHQSTGTNSFGPGGHRICWLTGTATINWTGSVDSRSNFVNGGVFTLSSISASHSIGQSGDTFLLRNSAVFANQYTSLLQMAAGMVELVGQFTSQSEGFTFYSNGACTIRWRNQSVSIPSADCVVSWHLGATFDCSGLVVSNAGKFLHVDGPASSTTTTAGTSVTCTSTAAFACVVGTTAFDGKIVVLESSPATLPTNAQVASGVSYGYSGAPQTGTGLIMDPATLATAMLTSFGSLPQVLVRTSISSITSQTVFVLASGSSDNNSYRGMNAVITKSGSQSRKVVVPVSSYDGSTRTVTLAAIPEMTIATSDTVDIVVGENAGNGTLLTGSIAAGSTATVLNISAISPSLSVNDQLKGRVLLFRTATATAALRGQGAPILSNTATTITVASGDAFTTAPAAGDTFTIV